MGDRRLSYAKGIRENVRVQEDGRLNWHLELLRLTTSPALLQWYEIRLKNHSSDPP